MNIRIITSRFYLFRWYYRLVLVTPRNVGKSILSSLTRCPITAVPLDLDGNTSSGRQSTANVLFHAEMGTNDMSGATIEFPSGFPGDVSVQPVLRDYDWSASQPIIGFSVEPVAPARRPNRFRYGAACPPAPKTSAQGPISADTATKIVYGGAF